MLWFFKYFGEKNWRFCSNYLCTACSFCKHLIIHIVFWEKRQFFRRNLAKNRWKIVIVTSTLRLDECRRRFDPSPMLSSLSLSRVYGQKVGFSVKHKRNCFCIFSAICILYLPAKSARKMSIFVTLLDDPARVDNQWTLNRHWQMGIESIYKWIFWR
jgi:hypothetical protein